MTTELPYPVSNGGIMATHCFIQAIAMAASVSVVVLTNGHYTDETVRAAAIYYGKTCRSLMCYQFPHLNPSTSLLVKAWHYLSGYPRQGFWSREAEGILVKQARDIQCEVLWCGGTHEAKYLRTGKQFKCHTVLTTQNVESNIKRQEMKATAGLAKVRSWVRWLDLRRLEKMGARWADVVTAVTSIDLEYYAHLKSPDRAFLLPFGYAVERNGVCLDGSLEEPNTICFIGSMDWSPNIKAARHLVQEVMPLVWKFIPDTKCFLVGKNPTQKVQELGCDKVTVTGRVPSVRKYYERAPVIVVPIQEVSGVKIKLIEAMAAGKAVVSTPAGTAGLNVEHDKHLMIADCPQKFASAIIELLGNRSKRMSLGERARQFVGEHLSPKETERQVGKILMRLKEL